MLKEIKIQGICSGRPFEKSYLTEDQTFKTKKQDGWSMIGFKEQGKTRNTWVPIGANVSSIVVYEATTGRRLETIL